jgi:methylthioribose-1-phosphate isomerase
VPFYVAAPRSTFDPATADGAAIPIEERSAVEVRRAGGTVVAAPAAEVWNPAFDVTPAELVTGYITDAGLLTRRDLARLV